VDALRRDEAHEIPDFFDYAGLPGLSNELKVKLERVRPRTLAQAGRIEGVTPAALALILARIRRADRQRASG
jgi:tRNA uridine 5-carboxymethylaminomethyl modification enzyme